MYMNIICTHNQTLVILSLASLHIEGDSRRSAKPKCFGRLLLLPCPRCCRWCCCFCCLCYPAITLSGPRYKAVLGAMHAFSARVCKLLWKPRKEAQARWLCPIFGTYWCSGWLSSPSVPAPSWVLRGAWRRQLIEPELGGKKTVGFIVIFKGW